MRRLWHIQYYTCTLVLVEKGERLHLFLKFWSDAPLNLYLEALRGGGGGARQHLLSSYSCNFTVVQTVPICLNMLGNLAAYGLGA